MKYESKRQDEAERLRKKNKWRWKGTENREEENKGI